jgi:hypothetical protein
MGELAAVTEDDAAQDGGRPAHDDDDRGRRRTAVALRSGGAAAVALAVLGWLAVGLTPSMSPGSFFWLSEPFELTADGASGYEAVDPAPGEAVAFLTYRNTGQAAVTVSVVAEEALVTDTALVLVPDHGVLDNRAGGTDRVTVPPGREVGVRQTLDLGCLPMSAGSGVVPAVVRLDAQTLGLTRRLELPYPTQVALRSTTDRPGC